MSFYSVFPTIPKIAIADVGASLIGEEPPYQHLIDAGVATLIDFEPDAVACEELNVKYKGTHKFYPYFIGDGNPSIFHETNWVATGSLFPPNTELVNKFNHLGELMIPKAQHHVQTTRLDDIAEIDRIDFLKMDIQGGELAALSNAPKLLETTLLVQVEVEFLELYSGQPLFADVDSYLRSQGFQFHCFQGDLSGRAFKPLVVHNNTGAKLNQVLWADAIYVKDWMKLEKLNEELLIKYIVLAHEIARSPDLAHLVAMHLDSRTNGSYASAYRKMITPNTSTEL
jgi:FkbM family methyltransferase